MEKNTGKHNFWLGKKMPQKMKDKMRNAKIGDKNPAKRLDVREKLRNAKLGKPSNSKGHKLSEEAKRKMKRLNTWSSKEKCNFWKGGISFEPYSLDWTETLKRSIRERDHYICQLCFQYGNAVHHIDYDKKNCDPKNLITLCNKDNLRVNLNRDYWTDYFTRLIG